MRRALLALLLLSGCDGLRAAIVDVWPNDWDDSLATAHAAEPGRPPLQPTFDGLDAGRTQAPVVLEAVVTGIERPTDIQFPPGRSDVAVVLQKDGKATVHSIPKTGAGRRLTTLLSLDPLTHSEQGLLGFAFHPDFSASGGRAFLHHSVETDAGKTSRVSELKITISGGRWTASELTTVLELAQPYANHNAGQIAFGPDGMLYIGWGDGGWRGDPHEHGQNTTTWLGSMLRIDVNRTSPGKAYGIPTDNPFLQREGFPPETWAVGLRNPWRFSFDEAGRMVLADVGQNRWEEVNLVAAGDNLGWNRREGRHCYEPKKNCGTDGFVDPIYEYEHGPEGVSITGGLVWTADQPASLKGRYLFGDFVSGRIWALELPSSVVDAGAATALGRFDLLLSTFGRDADGQVYVGDYKGGAVYRIAPE